MYIPKARRGKKMFNIGLSELILILLIAFIVVGPKDLPKVARALGRFVKYIRSFIQEVKEETGLLEVTEELKETEKDIKDTMRQADVSADLREVKQDLNKDIRQIKKDIKKK